eukprot:UN15632
MFDINQFMKQQLSCIFSICYKIYNMLGCLNCF